MRDLAIAAVAMLVLDSIYLNITRKFWGNVVSNIQNSPLILRYLPAALVYALLTIGLSYFVIQRGAKIEEAFLFGVIVYGIYELTNRAILDNWPMEAVIIDTLWGGVAMAATTYLVKRFR